MTVPADIARAAQTLAASLKGEAGLRLLAALGDFKVPLLSESSPITVAINTATTATATLFRRAAVTALSRAASAYQPTSSDDAAAVRDMVSHALDAEITLAADTGDDASYAALRALRKAVVLDLNTRGAALPSINTFTIAAALPALTLAHRFYQDATRSDELVTEANPLHPAFMPQTIRALIR